MLVLLVLSTLRIVSGICRTDQSFSSGDEDFLEKFKFVREEPANELGIHTKIMAQIYRPANQITEEHRINREFLSDVGHDKLMKNCKLNQKDSASWKRCLSNADGILSYVAWGKPEPKNMTVTYLELTFEPFTQYNKKDGEEEVCLLEEIYKTKVYIALNTFSKTPSNESGYMESVDCVEENQLGTFGEIFFNLFGDNDIIDQDAIYSFGLNEHFDRDPPYDCLLAIGKSESKEIIQQKCDFFCIQLRLINYPKEEVKKVLLKAKEEADMDEEKDSMENSLRLNKEELSLRERIEL